MRILAILLIFACSGCVAQPSPIQKIAEQVSGENIKSNLYYLASDKLEGRLMASRGDTLASNHVADWFRKQGLNAPYENGKSYFQAIEATRFTEINTISFNGITYIEPDGLTLYAGESFRADSIPVLLADFANYDDWRINIPSMPLNGAAVIINSNLFSVAGELDNLEEVLKLKGVKLIIWSGPDAVNSVKRKKENYFLPNYVLPEVFSARSPLPELSIVPELLQKLLTTEQVTINKDGTYSKPGTRPYYLLSQKISILHNKQMEKVKAPNVIGLIKGTDPDANCIIFSAHHDHDGRNGDSIYYGAVDNASGTAAIMEVAALMNLAAKQGFRPKRNIVFASFTGEERGLLGSFYFVANPLFPISKTHAVLNIDMLGRIDTLHADGRNPDTNYAYILVKDKLNRGLRKSLIQANESVKLTLDTHYELPQYEQRRIYGSDQYPFYEKGVPFIRIDCGFAKEYHKPQDTPDKINYELLEKQTKLVFLTLWNLANN
ncbi:M28 family metallopeptidase [Flavitalea sp.]|nr:M28 family peptidase [Flavitalea sp.]